jgi:protease I
MEEIMGILNALSSVDKESYKAAPTPARLKRAERVLILTGDDTEDMEFFYPYYRLMEEGYSVDVATLEGGEFAAKRGFGLKESKKASTIRPEEYALLYIPGGKAPQSLRDDQDVLKIVREFARQGKPIAAICHGAQVLISADIVHGRQIACAEDVREELEEAGGRFIDEALVEDGQFITARKPGDLPRHLSGVLNVMQGSVIRSPLPGQTAAA